MFLRRYSYLSTAEGPQRPMEIDAALGMKNPGGILRSMRAHGLVQQIQRGDAIRLWRSHDFRGPRTVYNAGMEKSMHESEQAPNWQTCGSTRKHIIEVVDQDIAIENAH
jgi:hypothetical protein